MFSKDTEKSTKEIIYYRGESQQYKEIRPSIMRDDIGPVKLMQERNYYRNNIRELREVLNIPFDYKNNIKAYIKALGKLQHYGIRTRLLDVTADKNVATYFACCNHFDLPGYVYTIGKEDGFTPIKSEWALSVLRKTEFIFRPEALLNENVDLIAYFLQKNKREDKQEYIHVSTLTKPVILDYVKVFSDSDINNIRYQRQKAGFILLGNHVERKNGKLLLKDEINTDDLASLQREKIAGADKLIRLFALATEGINHVMLFPDDTASIKLRQKYQDIYVLCQNEAGKQKLFAGYLSEEYGVVLDHSADNDNFINHLRLHLKSLYKELSNRRLFYFVFGELNRYYQYFRSAREKMAPAIAAVNQICKVA